VHLKHGTSCQAWPHGPLAPGPLAPGPLAPWPPGPWHPVSPRCHSKTQRASGRQDTRLSTQLILHFGSSMGSLVRPERACVVKHCHIWRFFHHPCIAKEVTICTKIPVSPPLLLITLSFLSVRLQNS